MIVVFVGWAFFHSRILPLRNLAQPWADVHGFSTEGWVLGETNGLSFTCGNTFKDGISRGLSPKAILKITIYLVASKGTRRPQKAATPMDQIEIVFDQPSQSPASLSAWVRWCSSSSSSPPGHGWETCLLACLLACLLPVGKGVRMNHRSKLLFRLIPSVSFRNPFKQFPADTSSPFAAWIRPCKSQTWPVPMQGLREDRA